ncbi:fatty-acid--CoA ligase [Rhodococcus sp. MH15]|uniref:acyl-CoA synthetase n=1 Tax=Rhodococcus sp. MH15 TaxID=1761014 RepID=UPI001C4F2898|nr:long-chain fatty acid--CoA ligase [Rhodococcus sp. MH15]MBW0293627.1 fatty-acid--CoA ligase [Rhodococcus sp. MH15]
MQLTQFVHRSLRASPEAVMTISDGRVRTSRESVDRIKRLAGGLQTLGLRTGDRVAILASNSDYYHEALLACWWFGAVASPVNSRWSTAEITYALEDSGSTVLLVDENFASVGSTLREACPGLTTVVYCGNDRVPDGMLDYEQVIAEAIPVDDLRVGGDTLALLLYTGGTTGVPKGVMISHQALMASALGTLAAGGVAISNGTNLAVNPLFHIAGIVGWLAQSLMGGTQVFVANFSPRTFLEAVDRYRPTTVGLVPTMLQMLVAHKNETGEDATTYDLSSVRILRYGASPISPTLLGQVMQMFPNSSFAQGYGMTETAHISMLSPADHLEGGDLLRSAGRALPHCEVKIVDPAGSELPPGKVGEIVTFGSHVMLGYWNKPKETAEVLRDGWMHTGDAGYLDARGYLFIVDRIKDMIVTGGENVYSTEVENALAQHESVAACSVIGLPDAQWGERVHAVVVLRHGFDADADELRAHVKTLIAGYKSPRTFQFVDALPLSAAGKVLKRDLRCNAT